MRKERKNILGVRGRASVTVTVLKLGLGERERTFLGLVGEFEGYEGSRRGKKTVTVTLCQILVWQFVIES